MAYDNVGLLKLTLERTLDRCAVEIASFNKRYADNALYALEAGDQMMKAQVRKDIFSKVLKKLEEVQAGTLTYEKLKAEYLKNLVHEAASSQSSSSQMTMIVMSMRRQVFAEAFDYINSADDFS